jgi:hypothetical protein
VLQRLLPESFQWLMQQMAAVQCEFLLRAAD